MMARHRISFATKTDVSFRRVKELYTYSQGIYTLNYTVYRLL